MLQIVSHTGLFHIDCEGVCVNTVVREEEEIVCHNRKGGQCRRYYIGVCRWESFHCNWELGCACRLVVPFLFLKHILTLMCACSTCYLEISVLTEGCGCAVDHWPIRRDRALTSSQPARPDPTGLPRGCHMMRPTVTTHGVFLSQICLSTHPFIVVSSSFFCSSFLFLDFIQGKAVDIHWSQIISILLCVHSVKDAH